MIEIAILTGVFLLGIITSYIASITGTGGLIAIPSLIFLGLPVPMAVATHKFGSLGTNLSSTYNYFKAKKVILHFVVVITVMSIIGALIGAQILIEIDEQLLSKIVGFIILLILPFALLSKAGLTRVRIKKCPKVIGYVLLFINAIYGGFFGAAGGLLAIYIIIFFFGLTYIESNAAMRVPWIIPTIVLIIFFAVHNLLHYTFAILLFMGSLIGGYLGSKLAIRKGNLFVKILVSVFVVISAVKLLFF